MRAHAAHCYDPREMADDNERLRESYEAQVRTLSERLARRERELAVLAEMASEVHSTEGVQSVFEIALDKVREKLGVSAAWIFTGEEGDKRLELAAARGVSEKYLEEVRRQGLSECLCREVFWTGHSMQARNTTQCPRMPDIVSGDHASTGHACIPMRFRGGSRGVLNVAARAGAAFTDGELRFLETLGHQIGLAVERARRGEAEQQRHEEARSAYRELRAAQERIIESEKMALLGTFAAGLAHEIRNPLNSIALQLSVIERRNARLDDGMGIRDLIRIIREEVSRLDALAGDFLQFSRADRVQQGLADLDGVVQHVLTLLEPQSAESGVRLVYDHHEGLPPLPIDAEKMKQVLINLVRNGIEAMTEGGQVTVKVRPLEDVAVLSVEDTGPGLPDGVDIFQLFVTTKAGGTGLGLSIARQIVIQHGGAISAENAPSGGARFEITLPLARVEAAS
jgi:signal transduction histidine kinase